MKSSIYLLLTLLVISCSQPQPQQREVVCEHVKMIDMKSDSIIYNVYDILELDGNLIIKNPTNINQRFSIFQISGDSLKYRSSTLAKGRARNEALNGELYRYDGNLYMTTNPNMVRVDNLYEIANIEEFSDIISYKVVAVPESNEIGQLSPIDSGNFLVSFAGLNHSSMFGILNIETQTIRELDIPYPIKDDRLSTWKIASICQGKLVKRENKSEYLFSCFMGLYVFKFKLESGAVKDLEILYDIPPKYIVKNGEYTHNINIESQALIPSVSGAYIYFLKTIIDNGVVISRNCIEVYDWDFNLQKKIILDKDVTYMSASNDGKRIYLVRMEDEGCIFSYIPINKM